MSFVAVWAMLGIVRYDHRRRAVETYAFRAQMTRLSPIGITPAGLRLDVGFAGEVAGGPLTGRPIDGIDYLLIRPDGVGVIDARELIGGAQGPGLAVHATGYIVPPFPMPDLTIIADPEFAWPDVELPMHGSSRIETGDDALAELARTVYAWTGSVNVARGTLEVDARSIAAALSPATR